MSDDNRAIVTVGQCGVVASVGRQIAITEKVLGRIQKPDCISVKKDSSYNSELLSSGFKLAVSCIEEGVRSFSDFILKMVDGMGDDIKPYLKMIYVVIRDWPSAEHNIKEMDDYVTVDSISIDDVLANSDYNLLSSSSCKTENCNLVNPSNATSDFDDNMYRQLKPHLSAEWEAATAAYGDSTNALESFVDNCFDGIDEQIVPYLKKFYREVKN